MSIRPDFTRLSALAIAATGILVLSVGPALAAPTPVAPGTPGASATPSTTGKPSTTPTTSTAPTTTTTPTTAPTTGAKPTATATRTRPATKLSVRYAPPTHARGSLMVVVTGVAPGSWVDIDGGAAGKNREAEYHLERQAGADGSVRVTLPAPSAGWQAGTDYRFTVTADGQAKGFGFRVAGSKSAAGGQDKGSGTGARTAPEGHGGLASTGV